MTALQKDTHFLSVPGGKLYVRSWRPADTPDEPPLILLHDSLGCVDLWREFPERLAEQLGRPVIAYDRLGFGRSSQRQGVPSSNFIDEEARDYFPLIKQQLSLHTYTLLGHSVGGSMALHIAASDPDCQAVVTMSAQAFVEDLTLQGIREAQQGFAQPGQMARLEKWHGDKAAWVLSAWTETWLSGAFTDWSLAPVIGKVTCPVLAIHGDRDEYGSQAFPAFISTHTAGPAMMKIIENCGHVPHRETPETVIDAVEAFLPPR